MRNSNRRNLLNSSIDKIYPILDCIDELSASTLAPWSKPEFWPATKTLLRVLLPPKASRINKASMIHEAEATSQYNPNETYAYTTSLSLHFLYQTLPYKWSRPYKTSSPPWQSLSAMTWSLPSSSIIIRRVHGGGNRLELG